MLDTCLKFGAGVDLGNYIPECRAATVAGGPYTLLSTNGSSAAYLPEVSVHHHCLLANLTKGSRYFYRCGDWSSTSSPWAPQHRTAIGGKGGSSSSSSSSSTDTVQNQNSNNAAGIGINVVGGNASLTSERRLNRPASRPDGGMRAFIFGDLGNNQSAGTIKQMVLCASVCARDVCARCVRAMCACVGAFAFLVIMFLTPFFIFLSCTDYAAWRRCGKRPSGFHFSHWRHLLRRRPYRYRQQSTVL